MSALPRVTCRRCDRSIPVRGNGALREHYPTVARRAHSYLVDPPPLCPGSGKRAVPYPGSPSEALGAGWCPGCGGTGEVSRSVPVEGTYPCATCGGGGTRRAHEQYIAELAAMEEAGS